MGGFNSDCEQAVASSPARLRGVSSPPATSAHSLILDIEHVVVVVDEDSFHG